MSMRFLVFLGSVREGRMGESVAKCVASLLAEKQQQVEIIDPLTLGSDGFLHQPIHFQRDPSKIPEWMPPLHDKIKESDGFVIVTPEYNATLPPALTTIMDSFPPASYKHKPCGIVAYSMGQFGGIRAVACARPFLSELGMVNLPSACMIPQIVGKFCEDSKCLDERINKNLHKVLDETIWFAAAIKDKLGKDGPPKAEGNAY